MIPEQHENPSGLNRRYYIQKIVSKRFTSGMGKDKIVTTIEQVDKDAEYFVLRLDEGASDPKHLAACRKAIHAYADAIEDHIPKLAEDLRERYPIK